ncbi:MAG: phosphoenolpyruvate--protein phosphotransferase [bacterium]|nr:phosphoenolpyruvate--protein phosphotransferase [bacterium]
MKTRANEMITLKGTAASPGVAIGHASIFYDEEQYSIPKYKINATEIKKEITRFNTSLVKTKLELRNLRKKLYSMVRDSKLDFFKMHLMVLDDPFLKDNVLLEITENNKNAEWALYEIMEKYIKSLNLIKDEYLSERSADLYDLAKRIMNNLLKKRRSSLKVIHPDSIIIANDLTPADTADIDKSRVIGFATNLGGKTSHTAIVARALAIPAVVGLENITAQIKDNDQIIVDGNNGVVVINPNETTLKEYKTAQSIFIRYSEDLKKLTLLDAVTLDNKKFILAGNIEIREEIDSVISHGGHGIGLFRTEFLYLNRPALPTENELFTTFREAVEKTNPYPVVFRTLDVGGDKIGGSIKMSSEQNPFLGYRAIRFCLENPDIFNAQLRAILRASHYGNACLMIPMISSVDEIKKVKEILESQKKHLKSKGEKFKEEIKLGSMIEIPSAAVTIDIIAKEVDFVSIGTNDLVQYTLAVDRNNNKISYLYEPFHPAVIRLIKQVVEVCHRHKIKVHVCGELASDPMAALVFSGMGIDELSMSAIAIPEIKKLIRSVHYSEVNLMAGVLKMETALEIKNAIHQFIVEKTPEYVYKKVV